MNNDIEALLAQLYHPGLKAIDPGLDRVFAFLEVIGNPQLRIPPVIHVAGTNGKGSLVANLQGIFEAAGYRVHCYTSPHLVHFNERIVIAGKPIEDDYLQHLLETLLGYIKKQPVTFFEATTAAAFLAFCEHPADVVLLETGMGGRLDATNVLDTPLLTAITPVGLDHCEYLGDSIAAIAGEKAGIFKHGVPCVVGGQVSDAAQVIADKAALLGAPLYRMGQEWQVNKNVYQSLQRTIALSPALVGKHQIDNAATAVACCDQIDGFTLTDTHIMQGIQNAVWPGRLQHLHGRYAGMLPQGIELWLDGGHNPHGAAVLAQWFSEQKVAEIHVICGMVKGKDTKGFLQILSPYITRLYAIAIPDESLSQPAQQIEQAGQELGVSVQCCSSLENALQTIAAHAKTPAIVCICGSLYLAGKVLAGNE